MYAPASWRDLSAIREIEKACFPLDAWPLLDMISSLTLPNIVRTKASINGLIIGFVVGDVKRYQDTGWIASICVLPEHRGQGVARRLLDICEREMNMPRVKLSVRESNQDAIGMYQHLGYAEVGRWKRYYKGGEDAVVMEKHL